MSEAWFYHALDLASIEGFDCDIPLDMGFDIQHHINEKDSTSRRSWRPKFNIRYILRFFERITIHEKIKSETLRFFNIGWIHWRWILGNNRSCLK